MEACKTVGEYKRNQAKIQKFCLEEATKAKRNTPLSIGSLQRTNAIQELPQPSKDNITQLANKNQKEQQSTKDKNLMGGKKP